MGNQGRQLHEKSRGMGRVEAVPSLWYLKIPRVLKIIYSFKFFALTM